MRERCLIDWLSPSRLEPVAPPFTNLSASPIGSLWNMRKKCLTLQRPTHGSGNPACSNQLDKFDPASRAGSDELQGRHRLEEELTGKRSAVHRGGAPSPELTAMPGRSGRHEGFKSRFKPHMLRQSTYQTARKCHAARPCCGRHASSATGGQESLRCAALLVAGKAATSRTEPRNQEGRALLLLMRSRTQAGSPAPQAANGCCFGRHG